MHNKISHETLVENNDLSVEDDFKQMSSVVLLQSPPWRCLIDVGSFMGLAHLLNKLYGV
jgi:hypothetical protein